MANNNKHTGPNVPALRFPEFSGEWETFQLSDLAAYSKERVKMEILSSNNYVSTENMQQDFAGIKDVISLPSLGSAVEFQVGDILISNIRPYLKKIWLSDRNGGCSTDVLALRTKNEKVDSSFLYCCLANDDFVSYVMSGAKGVKMPRGDKQHIMSYNLGVPSVQEQRRIAELVSLLEKRISAQSKIIEELTTLRSALIEKCAKQSGNCFSLSDILREVEERSTTANQYQVLSSTVKGIFSQKEYFNKDIASEDNKGYKVVRKGHVVLSPQNLWMGNINYNDQFDIGIVSPSYKVFSIKEGFNPKFIAALLQTKKALNEYMLASEQGASIVRRNLNIEAFMAIKFRIPDARQQDSLSMAITAINAKLNNERCYLEQLTMQKSCLLENMFI